MKYKRTLSLILSAILVLLSAPAAFAVDGDAVIDSVTFTYGGTSQTVTPNGKYITLTVPYSFGTGSLDLSSALNIRYNSRLNYNYQAPLYKEGATIKLGETKTLQANYSDSNGFYTSDYTVSLTKAIKVDPSFTGTVSVRCSVAAGETRLTREQFSSLYSQNDGAAFGGIIIQGADAGIATFKLGGRALDTSSGAKVPASDINSLTIVPVDLGKTSIRINAYGSDGKEVPGSGILDIDVLRTTLLESYSVSISQLETVTLSSFGIPAAFRNTAGTNMSKFKYTSGLSYGSLIYDYVDGSNYGSPLTADTYIDVSELRRISYVPSRSLTRNSTEILRYTAADASGSEYTGTIQININNRGMDLEDMEVSIKSDEVLGFTFFNFAKVYNAKNSGAFRRAQFILPEASCGELRYNYSGSTRRGTPVNENTAYYSVEGGGNLIANISFIPAEDYTGSFYIYYTAYNVNGTSPYTGRIRVSVTASRIGSVSRTIYQDEILSFTDLVGDINSAFKTVDSDSFSYITLSPPDSRCGTLYYDYKSPANMGSEVKSTDKYYRSGSNLLSDVSFVPKNNYEGSFDIKYQACNAKGVSYNGTLQLTVSRSYYDVYTLNYTVDHGSNLKLSSSDISAALRAQVSGANFEYLYFTSLPSGKNGTLYYNYSSETSPGTRVLAKSSYSYYRSGSYNAKVDELTVVPVLGYSGRLEFVYSAYASSRGSYSGKIIVNVRESGNTLGEMSYRTKKDTPFTLSTLDFSNALSKLTTSSLDYIQLALPAPEYGIFYHNYNTSTGRYDFKLVAGDNFYRGGNNRNYITGVTFVPAPGYSGTFRITYKAYDNNDKEYHGSIKVTVGAEFAYTDVAETSVYYKAIKWATEKSIITGTSDTTFSPNAAASRALIVLSMWKAAGSPEPKTSTNPFSDVSESAAYYKAVLWAVENGITAGTTATTFSPARTVNRGESMTFLYRQVGKPTPKNIKNPFYDVPANVYFHHAVSWAYENKVTAGTSANYYSPSKSCTRAQIITFLYRYADLTDTL